MAGNHGKLWTTDDDERLMQHADMTNQHLRQIMGRSENAIRYRRTHIATKLHLRRPETPLEDCVALMGGDLQQAQQLAEEWREKQASFTSFLDSRKRKADDSDLAAGYAFAQGLKRQGQSSGQAKGQGWHTKTEAEQIALLCTSIREEEGRLAGLWKDPDLACCLVRHYPGFDAYARAVQSWH